jgi:AbrB family looped-hinge helix DNA binding protein
MNISEIAVLSSKGQVTVPAPIREIFSLKKGSAVMFKVTDRGVFFMPVEIKERSVYTQEEWRKIEHLVAERGKTYKTSKGARKHLTAL